MAKDYQNELKDLYDTGITDRQIDEAKQKQISPLSKGYSRESISSKKPEPTFKSDVDDIVSGVKKVDDRLNKGIAKAAGKTEKGILNTKLSKDYKKGGKVSQLAKANGCAVRGKTRGRIC